jgi:hypothetical protein
MASQATTNQRSTEVRTVFTSAVLEFLIGANSEFFITEIIRISRVSQQDHNNFKSQMQSLMPSTLEKIVIEK